MNKLEHTQKTTVVRCLVFRDHSDSEEGWSALALELSQWAFGTSIQEVREKLDKLIEVHLRYEQKTGFVRKKVRPEYENLWFKAMVPNSNNETLVHHSCQEGFLTNENDQSGIEYRVAA